MAPVPALKPLNVRAGMLYCNLPHMQAKQGERVRLHLFSLGTENGIHAPSISASDMDWEARAFPTLPYPTIVNVLQIATPVAFLGLTSRLQLSPSALLRRRPWIGSSIFLEIISNAI